jgi:putative MFS transporter
MMSLGSAESEACAGSAAVHAQKKRGTTVQDVTEQTIVSGVEQLPFSRWHLKMRAIIGTATFFDGLDGVSVGYVLPALIGAWHLNGAKIGWIISVGFVGQAIGSLIAGWLAEVVGRVKALQLMIFLMGVLSIGCAVAHSYETLLWLRLFQGIAIGGEVPIAAAYISEILPAHKRGRSFLMYELLFVIGITAASILGAWIVPRFGWQWLFVIGGVPALLIAPLQFLCIESPRWLASKGRLQEAKAALDRISEEIRRSGVRHDSVPAGAAVRAAVPTGRATSWRELFESGYLTRTLTLWVMWSASYLLSKNLIIWLPSLYGTVYKIPVQTALNYGIVTTVLSLFAAVITACVIDRWGRKWLMASSFVCASVALLALCPFAATSAMAVVVLGNIAAFFISVTSFGLYLYTPELYPTRMRALGTSVATFWVRVVSMVSPVIIGYIVPNFGIAAMFLLFAICALLGAVACAVGAVETRGQTLEAIAP